MKILTLISLVLITFDGNGQSEINRDHIDPIQVYAEGQTTYVFSFNGKSQGLKLGSIVYADTPPCIEIHIVNNSEDTIINKYRERDSHIYWLRKNGRFDTIMPGGSMIVTSAWTDGKPKGLIQSPIRLKYQIGDSIYSNEIKVWGDVNPYKAPQVSELKNTVLIDDTEIDSLSIFIYKIDSLNAQLYNHKVSVQFRSLNSADSAFVTLDFEDEKTLFINKNSSGWIELKVTERDGTFYIRTLYLPLFKQTENKPFIYIFKSDYIDFIQGTERPYKPNMDLVYIWSNYKNGNKQYKSELDRIGVTSVSKKFPAVYKYAQTSSKSDQQEQLSMLDSILIAPVYSFDEEHYRYWSNQVEILADPDLNLTALNDLLNSIGIPNAFAINKYSRLEDYSNCNAFRIEFDIHDMLSYEFLIKLEKLYNMTQIYKIFTHGIQGVYMDGNGVH